MAARILAAKHSPKGFVPDLAHETQLATTGADPLAGSLARAGVVVLRTAGLARHVVVGCPRRAAQPTD
jgi:hypothetical protein